MENLDEVARPDSHLPGKTGVHFYENLKVNKIPFEQREKELLLNTEWPFPGEGSIVKQEDGPPVKK